MIDMTDMPQVLVLRELLAHWLSEIPASVLYPTCLIGGLLLGHGYFHALKRAAELIVRQTNPMLGVLLTLGRLALMTLGLLLAVQAGATALLVTLIGILIAQARHMRKPPPDSLRPDNLRQGSLRPDKLRSDELRSDELKAGTHPPGKPRETQS